MECTPTNPLPYKTYNPNDDCWDILAQQYEDLIQSRQNESEMEG